MLVIFWVFYVYDTCIILDKYTNELAKANNIDLNIDTMNNDDYLLDCVKYLECQKQIFEMCELESEAISK